MMPVMSTFIFCKTWILPMRQGSKKLRTLQRVWQHFVTRLWALLHDKMSDTFFVDLNNFEEEYGSVSEEFPLGNVFWTASNIFSVR